MKNTSLKFLFLATACFFIFGAFTFSPSAEKEKYLYSMRDGENLEFGSKTNGIISTVSLRGAFDGSKYRWSLKENNLVIEYVFPARGKHQSELEISHAYGQIKRAGDSTFIACKSNFKNFYIFNVVENYKVDSFSKEIKITVVTKSAIDSKSNLLVSTVGSDLRTIALPKGVKTKKIYSAIHPSKTIATFEYLEITDSYGKRLVYPAGDYVLVGADRLLK
jgi:hypothetical protein